LPASEEGRVAEDRLVAWGTGIPVSVTAGAGGSYARRFTLWDARSGRAQLWSFPTLC
jgi:hypothetical protein